ncbi:hypothetical protein QNA24_29920 [Rhodococcus qingshengii]|uniref:hypothetical protein n=1 Tax=Rhodococcus TaxID=1827 RepID=UPI001E3B50BA|nr:MULTISPECIES: hypothetical protein [Rhodococcus]MCD2099588.1 hypothetical protein [Rhodococcus rhodochrous]MCD2123956.1 hypothetical protein [Rhodococcus rhodochrous]MCQ4136615.1 hypothetical protein [Rhodococcus rhodochrous]MDJ0490601.1 hypothetical protein [Rhodococcus qingshengii]
MTDILKRFAWWEWTIIALNFLSLTLSLILTRYGVAWNTFLILALFIGCAVLRSINSMLEDENNALRRELGIPVWK